MNTRPESGDFSASPWVLNEGAFLSGNAAVDVIYGNGSIESDVFQEVNALPLGDVLQSGIRLETDAFLVLNGSEKVQVVNAVTFENKGVIEGISYPRYIHSTGNGKLYLSSGSLEGTVTVIDENDYSSIVTIPVGFGPEKMCSFSDRLFVCNSGGWSEDNTLSVINSSGDVEVARLDIGDRPMDCVCDANGNVWVLCSGSTFYDENWNITGHSLASVYKIDAISLAILHSQPIGAEGDHPSQLELSADGSVVYLNLNGIKKAETSVLPLSFESFIEGDFEALNVNPADGSIWLSSYSDFVSSGWVHKYIDSGVLIKNWEAGIGPNSIIFPR
jgi:DNA-binding beta-propeller fold protein YncE